MQPDTPPTSMLELALEYAAANIPVFPCRPADEEVIDPSTGEIREYTAKSPYTYGGLRDATTNGRIIRRFWSDHPHAMVGIPTGPQSGVWVLDLDRKVDANGEEELARLTDQHGPLPATQTVRTPSGGLHLLFRLPKEGEVRNRGKVAPAVDVRGAGGYVIAPGSVRADGRTYEWADHPDEPAEAPQWLIDLVIRKPVPVDATHYTGTPSTSYVEAIIESEIADLESTTQGRNSRLNDAAFTLGTLVGAGVLDRTRAESMLFAAAQYNGYTAKDGAHAARATIRSGLQSGIQHPRHVPEQPSADEGARLAANLIGRSAGEQTALVSLGRYLSRNLVTVPHTPSTQPIAEEGEPPAPPMHPDPFNPGAAGGLLRDISLWVTETAIIPVPELSLAAALGLLAGLFGDKALGPTSTGVNLYMTTILDTGGGKGHPPKAIRRISDELGAMGVVSNGDHTSYAAMERTLRKSNTKSVAVVMDEFGITLQDVNNRNNRSSSASIRKFLLSIYDQANSVFDGRTYAAADVKGDDEPIVGPALTVLAMTTLDTLYAGLTEASISDGFLNRFIFVGTEPRETKLEPPKLHRSFDIPTKVLEGVEAAVNGFPRPDDTTTRTTNKWRVPFVDGEQGAAYQRWGEIFLWQHDPVWSGEKRDIRARAAENTLRLATLRAISKYAARPAIDLSDVEWAWAIVYRSIILVQEGINTHMVASPAEALRRAIRECLEGAEDGVPYSKLLQRRGVRGADMRQLDDAFKWLVETGEVVDLNARPKPGKGSKFRLVE